MYILQSKEKKCRVDYRVEKRRRTFVLATFYSLTFTILHFTQLDLNFSFKLQWSWDRRIVIINRKSNSNSNINFNLKLKFGILTEKKLHSRSYQFVFQPRFAKLGSKCISVSPNYSLNLDFNLRDTATSWNTLARLFFPYVTNLRFIQRWNLTLGV